MKPLVLTLAALTLAACTTPMTTLKNKKTGQVVTCGGSATGSMTGGMIGYDIQKKNDQDCVGTYKKQGFVVIDQTNP